MKFAHVRAVGAATAAALLLAAAAWASPGITFTPGKGWQQTGVAATVKGAGDWNRAFQFYLDGRYSHAAKLFADVVKSGDKSLREEAGILAAECWLAAGEYRAAFKLYEDFITAYPDSQWIDRAYEGELECARAALAGARIRYIGLKIWRGYGFAEKVVEKITSRRPFSDYARDAQMALANSYFQRHLYMEASSAYRQYLELFADSPQTPDALLGVARSYYLDARGSAYSPVGYYRTVSVVDDLERERPGTPQAVAGDQLKKRAEADLARHYYLIGLWYVKMKHPDSALVYFNKVITTYGHTTWAADAKAQMDKLSGQVRGGHGS